MRFNNNFNAKLPYKVVAVNSINDVKYKITQPLSLWIFGLTKKYYSVTYWYRREKYGSILYFGNKKEVDEFVLKETQKIEKLESIKEIVVFDSLLEKQ